jgi:histidinol-phosphate aminotransferase
MAKELHLSIDEQALLQRVGRGDIDIVMLTSPNNPTGDCLEPVFIERLLDASDALVIIDHAYIEFAAPRFNVTRLLDTHTNLAILRTFSKAYALAGMRIGYMLASQEVTRELLKVRQPYSVDALAVCAALAALEQQELVDAQVASIVEQRDELFYALQRLGLPVVPSEANYLLFRVPGAHEVWQLLHEKYGILVRDLSRAPGLADCLRVTIGTAVENNEFLQALSSVILHEARSE